jgi:Tfp pilus assembly protein PilV
MPSRPQSLAVMHSPRRKRRGFALLITITLLAFLVLLLVSLASLTRVETQVAANSQTLAQARQNALMALNLALGQLQRHAGPDQRVTARADVLPPPAASHTWATVPSAPPPATQPTAAQYTAARDADKASIDTYWRASRNRQWTGVWKNHQSDPFKASSPKDFNPIPGNPSDDTLLTPAWLVSGNEESAAFSPETTLNGLSVASNATDDTITDSTGAVYRLLVGAHSTAATVSADLDRLVTAPQKEIRAANVPGTDGNDTVIGHYAWWVGDEGVKARANLVDSYAATNTVETNRTRLQSAQRPAIEAMTTSGTDGLGSTYPANDSDLLHVFTPAQLSYLSNTASFPAELKARFHDLSVTSRGVLADTKNGGLKVDLSYLFGQHSLADFRTALQAAYGDPSVAPSSVSNSIFSTVATPYATLPPDASGSSQRYSDGIFNNSATWEQLWSFANQGASINAANEGTPRLQTRTEHGLYPLIMQSKLFFSLRIDGGTIWVDVQPVVVLANPYNVKLGPADYVVRFSGTQPRLRFGNSDDTGQYLVSGTPPGQIATANVFTANTRFVLSSTGMEAGEAQIFTISAADNPGMVADRLAFTSAGNTSVILKNDFDPLTAVTIDSGQALPGTVGGNTVTHAALVVGQSGMFTALYLDASGPDTPAKALQFTFGQYTSDPANPIGLISLVDPISSGSRVGGGLMNFYNQPPGSAATATPQQAPFAQVNYRALWVNYSSSNSGANHPVEFARTYVKNGASAPVGSPFNPWLDAHHMRPSPGASTTRWGIVNRGENSAQDQSAPQTLTPLSVRNTDAGFHNFLYDLPRTDHPLASLGQLQHFNTAGFITASSFLSQGSVSYNSNIVHTWQVNYPISNSYPQPRVQRDQLFFSTSNFGYHYDGSYIWNDALWDRFYFSTFPQSASFDFATDKLVNARYAPFRDRSQVEWDREENFRGDGNPATAANSRRAAQNLLVEGAFNINSTSVEAWKAVFSSLKNVPIASESSPTAPYARTLYPDPASGSTGAATGLNANAWSGFRDLTRANIQALAEEMVLQIRKRGPFLSLSDFVNRRLTPPASDPLRLGLSGALQAAIDRVVNQRNDVTAPLNALTNTNLTNSPANALQENAYILPNGLAGFPGYLLQADVLSALGPTLSARSDTFTIRTYGDSVNPATGDITGRAWCEAVVQRTPDYVNPSLAATSTPAANSINATFGRRFQIVSFRWLGPDEI